MSTQLGKLFSLDMLENSIEAFGRTYDLAELLQNQQLKSLPPWLSSITSLLGSLSSSSEVEIAIGVADAFFPFLKISRALLKIIKTRNDPDTFSECVALVYFIAYLESLEKYLKETKIPTDYIPKHKHYKFRDLALSEEEANKALSSFPNSALASVLKDNTFFRLQQIGFSDTEAKWFAERAAWDSRNHVLKHWKQLPEEAKNFSTVSISEWNSEQKDVHDISNYLKKFIKLKDSNEISENRLELSLKDIYVQLNVQTQDLNSGEIKEDEENIHDWVENILLDNNRNRVIYIQGNSGQGKTAFCQMFADWVSKKIFPAYIPVFIDLQEIDNIKDSLQETFASVLQSKPFFSTNKDWLNDDNKRFLIFLDGLDELFVPEEDLEKLIYQVINFQDDVHNQFLITERSSSRGKFTTIADREKYYCGQIKPMTSSQRSDWIRNWSKAIVLKAKDKKFRSLFNDDFDKIKMELSQNRILLVLLSCLNSCEQQSLDVLAADLQDFRSRKKAIDQLNIKEIVEKEIDGLTDEEFHRDEKIEIFLVILISLLLSIGYKSGDLRSLLNVTKPGNPRVFDGNLFKWIEDFISTKNLQNLKIEGDDKRRFTDLLDGFYLSIGKIDDYLFIDKPDDYKASQEFQNRLGELYHCISLSIRKSQGFKEFLEEKCPDDINKEMAGEPFLLYLIATLYESEKLSLSKFYRPKEMIDQEIDEEAEIIRYRKIIYEQVINKFLEAAGQKPTFKKLEKKGFNKKHLEVILQEAALCFTLAERSSISFSTLLIKLHDESESLKILVGKKKTFDLDKILNNLIPGFFISKDPAGGDNKNIEFASKRFYEFLFCQNLSRHFLIWASSSEDDSFVLDETIFIQDLYLFFGFGIFSRSLTQYLNLFLRELESSIFNSLFSRLYRIYAKWCLNELFDLTKNESFPWSKLQNLSQVEKPRFNLKEADVYVGINTLILLLEMHRISRQQDAVKERLNFHPCKLNVSALNRSLEIDRANWLRIAGYFSSIDSAVLKQNPLKLLVNKLDDCLDYVDFSNAVLEGIDFSYVSLKHADLRGVNLKRANLKKADLSNADFGKVNDCYSSFYLADLREAIINNSDFSHADLSLADLRNLDLAKAKTFGHCKLLGARLKGANLSGADLSNSILSELDLSNFSLYGTDLSGADLSKANLYGVNFTEVRSVKKAILVNADIKNANLRGVDLSGCNLTGIDLTKIKSISGATFKGANLEGANLQGVNTTEYSQDPIFTSACLRNANLAYTELIGVLFDNANLESANLSYSEIRESDFSNANLSHAIIIDADLSGAEFANANLSDSDLSRSDLRDANFKNADLSGANLHQIKFNKNTKWQKAIGLENARNIPEEWRK
jgi:uncharacterized protein YjbI with pentapeptide repeats